MTYGPTVPFCEALHGEKYREAGESFSEAMNRLAAALKDSDSHYRTFRSILLEQRFMPAGRVQAAMGVSRRVTPYNCFVSNKIADSFTDGSQSIMKTAENAAITMRMGGGIGYDFSTLRPKGAIIKKLMSKSSGPLGFMPIFDAICRATSSAGNRRGAQMGVLRVDHPDIGDFIRAKQNVDQLTGFNISVAVTDAFMEAVAKQGTYELKFGRDSYGHIEAAPIWEKLMRSTWDWAEPGVLFIDTINKMNNLWYCEKIAATNPCGEQPLPPFGACLLGSFNLTKYVQTTPLGRRYIDINQLELDIEHVVRAMDNVVDRAIYPLHEQEQEAHNKRRMGLGVTGMANAIEALGHPYGSDDYVQLQNRILATIRDGAYIASAQLAKEKGSFPLYDEEKYLKGKFIQTLPDHVLEEIRQHGIRNSHLTSIAPTGTISMTADNVSSSCEPVFSLTTERSVFMDGGKVNVTLNDYGYGRWGVQGKTADQVTVDEHLKVLLSAQKYVDSAVSKTCNVPPDTPWDDFKSIYMRAWEGGAKGCTTFNIGGKRMALLMATPTPPTPTPTPTTEPATSCEFDPTTGRRTCE